MSVYPEKRLRCIITPPWLSIIFTKKNNYVDLLFWTMQPFKNRVYSQKRLCSYSLVGLLQQLLFSRTFFIKRCFNIIILGFTYPKPFLIAINWLAAFCMSSLVYYYHLLFGGGFSNSKNIASGFQPVKSQQFNFLKAGIMTSQLNDINDIITYDMMFVWIWLFSKGLLAVSLIRVYLLVFPWDISCENDCYEISE